MAFFDNAKTIVIGSKEVALLKIGNKTVYEKSAPAPSENVHLTFVDGNDDPIPNFELKISKGSGKEPYTCDENGELDLNWESDVNVSVYFYLNPSTPLLYHYVLTNDVETYPQIEDEWSILEQENMTVVVSGDDLTDITATLTVPS